MGDRQQASSIAWRAVVGLALIQAAITFGWTAYGMCQPTILAHYGLGRLATEIAVLQGAIGLVVEPLLGRISDRRLARAGSRFATIIAGASVTGLLFLSVATVQEVPALSRAPWLLLGLMLAWVAAMDTFRAPSLALLRSVSRSTSDLPLAGAVLTAAGALVRAASPLLSRVINAIGTPLTFVCGAAVLGLATVGLRRLTPARLEATPASTEEILAPAPAPAPLGARLLLFPALLGVASVLLTGTAANAVSHALPFDGLTATSLVLLCASLLALPIGRLAARVGTARMITIGSLGMLAAVGLAALVPLGAAVLAAVSFAAIDCTGLPLSLERHAPPRAGVAAGLYFGALSFTLGVVVTLPPSLPPTAFAAAGVLLVLAAVALAPPRAGATD